MMLIAATTMLSFSGCSKDDDNDDVSIIGKWTLLSDDEDITITLTFKRDGTFYIEWNGEYIFTSSGKYKVSGKTLRMKFDDIDEEWIYEIQTLTKSRLVLYNGSTIIFTR
jgi:uncharacterized protein (TIGR03066 family)